MNPLIEIANQIFQIEKKLTKDGVSDQYARYIQKIKQSLSELKISFHDPEGEKYSDTRTDIEANIVGDGKTDFVITQAIKPIVFEDDKVVQMGVVIVEGK
ncbi:hypothetical protein [Lacihabitans lacunae]|jgi:hypothetical protein|uniref:Uncharacterized protein n=1 Tax=Lacihabitans lacunae TaxID=1028214 RepID=A0ABV7YXR8_9BACT